ncbi:MAG: PepSY-associated TM helix domain-containing protein [Alphaproteobacteria bacterium]
MKLGVSSERPWRRTLRLLHLWVGVTLCIPLVAIGLTGSVLVFEHELEALFESPSPLRAGPGPARTVAEIVDASRAAAPDGLVASAYVAPEHAGEAASVRFAAPGRQGPGGGRVVLVDPATLATHLVPAGAPRLLRQIFLLHANLLVSGRDGREIVGWFGVAMLVLGFSGLVLWWPRGGRWKAALTVKRGAHGYRLQRDLHGVVGIWSLVVFIVVSASGVYLAFPQTTGEILRAALPARDLRATAQAIRVEPVRGSAPMPLDDAVALAESAVPGTAVRMLALPGRPDQPLRVSLVRGAAEHGAPGITVWIDPGTRRVIEIRDPRDYTAGETVLAWQHALHAGSGLGWGWKIAVFLSGLLPALFAVTGIWMWLLKRRARRNAGVLAGQGAA